MNFQYVGYTEDRKLTRGKISASDEEAVLRLLSYSGCKVLSLRQVTPFFNVKTLTGRFSRIDSRETAMLSRQLALLLEAGSDVATALDLLREQIGNRTLKNIVGDVVTDIRGGLKLSQALQKHSKVFSTLYCRTIAVSEQSGNLESGLRRMADYIEKQATTAKKIQGALIYPIIVLVLAVVVVAVLVTFVLPAFVNLYSSLGTELPGLTRALLIMVNFLLRYEVLILAGVMVSVGVGFAYSRTTAGRYHWDKLRLRLPLLGRITTLSELSCCCRTISVLFRAGVPLPEIITLAMSGTSNKVVSRALSEVREGMLKGEGLSRPMSRNHIFLPLMVQMAAVGEGTGNLDSTMDAVAQSYEMEADGRTNTLISMITPAMTLFMGGLVGFIAAALISAMYSMLGAIG